MLKRFLSITTLALLPAAAGATTFVIPAAGTGPGAGNSHWETELVIHNASSQTASVTLKFHTSSGSSAAQPFVVGPRTTATTVDVVKNVFGVAGGTGAITIDADDATASHLAITSRTFNSSSSGQFGQEIAAVNVADADTLGDMSVLAGPGSANDFRFNFGIYAVTDATVQWQLVRTDGTIAATKSADYAAGTQFQYNAGVSTFFNSTPADGDVIYTTVTKGKAVVYGSNVNQGTGDPTTVSPIRTRVDSPITVGVDVNEDGTVELKDNNGDGVIDQPLTLFTVGFPNYFRVVVLGQNAQNVKIELADNSTPDVLLLDDKGNVSWAPSSTLRGTDLTLKLKVTVNGVTQIVTIPAHVQ
jgi:hypothetical protein